MMPLLTAGWLVVAVTTVVWCVERRLAPRLELASRLRHELGVEPDPARHPRVRVPLVSAFVAVATGLRARAAARARNAAGAAGLPLAVELVAVAAGAGAAPLQALAVAAQWSPEPVAGALDAVGRAVALGASVDDALARAGADPVVAPLVAVLAPALRVGAPLAPLLQTLAADLRAAQSRAATAQARRVSVQLIFPLVLLVLPAFALLTVVPALVAGWRSV